jgi:hypothetical protein
MGGCLYCVGRRRQVTVLSILYGNSTLHYLQFSKANAKLAELQRITGKRLYSFDTLSGSNCPFAKECKSQVVYQGEGKFKLIDGPHTKFRCFSASAEVLFPAVRNLRLQNSGLHSIAAQSVQLTVDTILPQIPHNAEIIRLSVGGDFSTQNYFDAWIKVCELRPEIEFYAYTKSLPFWVKRLGAIPRNLRLTASYGGYRDDLIGKHNLRSATVVFSEGEAKRLGLQIDHTDEIAYREGPSFALLIHGIQPAGSAAAQAIQTMKRKG